MSQTIKMNINTFSLLLAATLLPFASNAFPQTIERPEEFFGFPIGADGELARYPRVVEYLRHLAEVSDRVMFEERGKSTLGNPYVLVKFSSAENLARLDRLVEINRRLADPRGLSEVEAQRLASEGRPFYLLFATIHSTEVGNGQAIIEIAHRLATDSSRETEEILANVVLLMVPSQNPDGQILVIDHWYQTEGTEYSRTYPDLYHHYVGHDDNRDWFMFTQKETRLAVEIQNEYRPQLTHDMHQMGDSGARIFVPPFVDPYDPNIHPILVEAQAQVGLAMAGALVAEGKEGVSYHERFDLWTPARQYMVYHGQPRILTEIARASLADPLVNRAGSDQPLGPQEPRWNFPRPYSKSVWRLRDIIDYGSTAVFAGLTYMAKYPRTWLENFYRIHRDWVERDDRPYGFVIPAVQRDPFETYELLEILDIGDVEIHRARSEFSAGGQDYPAGSWVVKLAQPYGAFAKTMLEKQIYPDLRHYPGGPPIPPYDVTAHTLGWLMGVRVDQVEEPFEAELELLHAIRPTSPPMPGPPQWAYLVSPESNAGFLAVARLQSEGLPVYRTASELRSGGKSFAPGTWIVPPDERATGVLKTVSEQTGLVVSGADEPPEVEGFRMKLPTRVGLWKAANNMPAGWLMWLLEQYGVQHRIVSSADFEGDLSDRYDVIVLPSGTNRGSIVTGLSSELHDESWAWAYGVGEEGWQKLRKWVQEGGTLAAIGSAVETARELVDLPMEGSLPKQEAVSQGEATIPVDEADRRVRDVFQSPARLMTTLKEKVVDPSSIFYCPGSLIWNELNPNHPVAYGMPSRWPVFFRRDQAYRLRPGFDSSAEVVARYPAKGGLVASGWLLGGELLRDQANVMAFQVGRGNVVTLASQVGFRAQTRATFKLLLNAIFQGPAEKLGATELSRLSGAGPPTSRP
jgi:hypothetical protein